MKSTPSQPTANGENNDAANPAAALEQSVSSTQKTQSTLSEAELLQLISRLEIWDFCLSLIKESPDNKKAFSQSLDNFSELSEFISWLKGSPDDFLIDIYQKFIDKYQNR